MWSFIWHTFFFDPIYNSLVFFIELFPGGDVGLAIIATVVFIKLIILPLSIKVAKMQAAMREIDPKMKKIKETITDRQKQAEAMMALYKEAGINPLANIALLFIQFPVVIALYFSVGRGGGVPLPAINTDVLYSFIPNPDHVSMLFLGLVDISEKHSIVFALLAAVTQFIQVRFIMPAPPPRESGKELSVKDEFARSMQLQMRYMMPLMIGFIAYTFSAAIGIYFTVSNLMAIATEMVVKKHRGQTVSTEKETVKS